MPSRAPAASLAALVPAFSLVLAPVLVGCASSTPPLAPAPGTPSSSAATVALPVAPVAPPPPAASDARAATGLTPLPPPPAIQELSSRALPLPGATAPVTLDYIAFDVHHARLWVPVGDTGSVDVYDVATDHFSRVDGFKTAPREVNGKKRTLGPSAVAIGDSFAYVGDRASSQVCAVDLGTLERGGCVTLASPTDGVAWVAASHEVWVTTPRDHSIVVLDASKPGTLKPKTTITLEGAPEGYASDDARGVFFTNLEDKDRTVAIDIASHRPKATLSPGCGAAGPRGLAADGARGLLYVACTDRVVILDPSRAAKAGDEVAGRIDGPGFEGIDNIDWLESRHLLYVAASRSARLGVERIDDGGKSQEVATGPTSQGARNAVADTAGNAYVADPVNARILVFAYGP